LAGLHTGEHLLKVALDPTSSNVLGHKALFSSADMELYFCRARAAMALMMKTEWVPCMLEFNNFMMKI
jgi:hypothetical protein